MEIAVIKEKFATRGEIKSLREVLSYAANRGYGAPQYEGFDEFRRDVNEFEIKDTLFQHDGYIYALDFIRLTKKGNLELRGNILMPVEGECSKDFFINMSTTLSRQILVQLSHNSKTHTLEFINAHHVNQLMGTVGMDEGFYLPMAWLLQPMCDVVKNYYIV